MRIHPKKSLGQNFLVDPNVRNKIIQSLSLNKSDIVLEIGSGRGEITELISSKAAKVYALELDHRLNSFLSQKFKQNSRISLINQDILKFDLPKILKEDGIGGKIKIFGNIPYYISSPIIEYIIKNKEFIDEAFITVQKEFAKRVVAHPGSKEYSSFSCFVQYYTLPENIFYIKKGSFFPVPKVDSSFLHLKIRGNPAVKVQDEKELFKIIRAAFNQRRKTIRNSLKGMILNSLLERFLIAKGFTLNARAEELSLVDFAELVNMSR
jgi:16S rRNA (adenine1518-N6/adenine1519-N6)-dimethyltransferase